MAEKDTIIAGKLKQAGDFDFNGFYEFVYDWLRGEDYDIGEKKYSEKVSGESKNIEIIWECYKKVSDYFKFMIKMDWNITGLKKIEVVKDGKKIKTNSGTIEIKFRAVLIKDYESRWENHPFWKFLRGFYDRYIIRTRVEQYEERLLGEINEYIAEIKGLLAIETKSGETNF